ncbi:MAG: Crp/Fnr family transcriptional regulator [Pseudohaliea sp.]
MWKIGAIEHALKRRGWFREQPVEVQRDILAAATWREYAHGDTILHPGALEDALYAVVSGIVKHSYVTTQGEEHLGWIFWPGDWFNAMALIDGQVLPHRAHVAGAVCLVRVPGKALAALARRQPDVYRRLAGICTQNFRDVAMRLTEVGLLKPEQRIARLLLSVNAIDLELGSEPGTPLHITQKELCELLLLSRSTTGKALASFSAAGWIRHQYGRIHVLKREPLMAVAGESEREPPCSESRDSERVPARGTTT